MAGTGSGHTNSARIWMTVCTYSEPIIKTQTQTHTHTQIFTIPWGTRQILQTCIKQFHVE